MKYGKIRIENGCLSFYKRMMLNNLPCSDIMWVYMRREGESSQERGGKQVIANYLVVITRRRKKYKFDMTEREVQECILHLRALNPNMAVGFPRGGRLPLLSLPNTRDLGAIATEDGRHILPRRLLRSGELYHAALPDQQVLGEEYRLRTVIDFRSQEERKGKPDVALRGVAYYHIPIIDEMGLKEPGVLKVPRFFIHYEGRAEDHLVRQYESFVKDIYSVKQYARFLDVLLNHQEGAVLWHGSLGKDRTGVAAAILLCALGVPEEAIREDFLKSNACLAGEMECILRYLEAARMDSIQRVENVSAFYRVKQHYMDIVMDTIRREYGSVDRFLRKGLYMTPKAIEELREKYLI
ncbi:MAG: tyrosine-protein phosphatase [Eubacteriales bacterium]|nr:tyrosine-protein phosphatase [Eubacteriales bacterium]